MRLITTRSRILGVAKAWHNRYPPGAEEHHLAIGRQLDTLDLATVSAAKIDALIGNDSWTAIRCDECTRPVSSAVELDPDGSDYEERPSGILCRRCLTAALKLFRPARERSNGR